MKIAIANIPAFVFLGVGVFLLLHGFILTGAFCIFLASVAARVVE